jgi:hypothetical protein
MRQVALWVVIEERLQANDLYVVRNGADKGKLGHVFVHLDYSSLLRPFEGPDYGSQRLDYLVRETVVFQEARVSSPTWGIRRSDRLPAGHVNQSLHLINCN